MGNKYKTRYLIKNSEGLFFIWSLGEIIENINTDRSEDWQDYDITDWREGLSEFTEFTLIKEVKDGK